MSRRRLPLLLLLICACRAAAQSTTDTAPSDTGGPAPTEPVKVAEAAVTDLPVIVSGPGRTESTETQQVSAAFDGVLLDLLVSDGDHVKAGHVLGWTIARDSEAALAGAQAMSRAARTPEQRHDAQRALELAQRSQVKTALRAPEAGIVLSHQANEGARVSANQPIVTLVAADAMVFVAQIAQADLARIHPGQATTIDLAAAPDARQGTVHAVLPGGSATDLTAPVRVDFAGKLPREINLFGVAHIRVGVHAGALVVPRAAVVRDDVSGSSRVAVVDATNHAHWVSVNVGLTNGQTVELLSPPFPARTRVVVTGQVGLPEAALVRLSE